MTSTAYQLDEITPAPSPLTQAMIEQLDEQTVTALLVARFRAFVGNGYPVNEALLAAVGSPNGL
jgi:hypothetical protein